MDYLVTNKTIEKIKYDLVREGLIDYSDLIKAIEEARTNQASLSQILIQQKTQTRLWVELVQIHLKLR